VLLFTLTSSAAHLAVDPDIKCSIKRCCLSLFNLLFRMTVMITFLCYLGQPLKVYIKMVVTFRRGATLMKDIFSLASLFFTLFLLFLSINISSANTLLGSVTLVGTDGGDEVYPIVSGNKIAYGQRALIRVTGGSFVVEEGSDLVVTGQKEHLHDSNLNQS